MSRAFLNGINAYKDSPLRGCINDIVGAHHDLPDVIRDKNVIIRTLADANSTKKAIVERLKWLVSETFVHSKILFYNSSHGSYVPNRNPSKDYETTGMDQVIIPVDYNWQDGFITDDDLHALFAQKNPRCKLVFISDSCFSGTLCREWQPQYLNSVTKTSIDRFLPPPIDIQLRDTNWSDGYQPDVKSAKFDIPNFIYISGCSDTQTSADAYIDGDYHGAMSFYLQRLWKENLPVKDMHKALVADLKQAGYSQTPKLTIGPDTDVRRLF